MQARALRKTRYIGDIARSSGSITGDLADAALAGRDLAKPANQELDVTSRPVESAPAQELLDSFLAQVHLGIRMVVVGEVLSRHLQDLVTTQPVRPVIPGLVVHKQAIRLRTGG